MQISVTVLALIRSIREIQICMTVTASYAGVLAAKREAGFRMIESDLFRDQLPIRRCMACLARKAEPSVRTAGGCEGMGRLRVRRTHRDHEHK